MILPRWFWWACVVACALDVWLNGWAFFFDRRGWYPAVVVVDAVTMVIAVARLRRRRA